MGTQGLWARELHTAQERQADPMPLPFTAYFWRGTWDSGEFGKCVFELRPVAWQSAVSGVRPCGHAPTALPAPTAQPPGPGAPLAHGPCCLLGHWTLNLGSPRACLECLAEGLWASYFHWFFLSLKQKLRYVPDYSGEQAYSSGGEGC